MIKVVGGIAAGAAAMMLAPSAMSVIARAFKPVAKALIKGGLLAFESGKRAVHQSRIAFAGAVDSTKSAVSGAVESIEDLAAEARAEMAESQKVLGKSRKKKEA